MHWTLGYEPLSAEEHSSQLRAGALPRIPDRRIPGKEACRKGHRNFRLHQGVHRNKDKLI